MTVNIDPPEEFCTSRLKLRKPQLSDAEQLHHSYISKPHIPKYMSWVAHKSLEETIGFIEYCIKSFDDKSNFEFVIELKDNPGVGIGMVGMHPLQNAVGFGYVIAEEFWNQGITSEALGCLMDWALSQPSVFRVQAFCDVENQSSARVMEKAGMSYEGRLKKYFVYPNISNDPRDSLIYSKV